MLTVFAELSLMALAATLAGLMLVDGTALVGLLVPGDLVVVSASTFAGWPGAAFTAAAGAVALVAGHAGSYLVGRRYGAHLWSSRLGRRIGLERWCRAERALRNGGDRTLVATPFIPVVNTVLPLLSGALGVRPARYLVLIAVADVAWITLWTGVGAGSGWLATALGTADLALVISAVMSVAATLAGVAVLRRSHRRTPALRPRRPTASPARERVQDLPPCVAGAVQDAASAVTAQHGGARDGDGCFAVVVSEPAPGVRVVQVSGDVVIDTSPRLDTVLREEIAAGPEHLVVDLSAVRFLNYHGVVSLVAARHTAAAAGVAFHLTGTAASAVRRPLRISGVLRHLERHRGAALPEPPARGCFGDPPGTRKPR